MAPHALSQEAFLGVLCNFHCFLSSVVCSVFLRGSCVVTLQMKVAWAEVDGKANEIRKRYPPAGKARTGSAISVHTVNTEVTSRTDADGGNDGGAHLALCDAPAESAASAATAGSTTRTMGGVISPLHVAGGATSAAGGPTVDSAAKATAALESGGGADRDANSRVATSPIQSPRRDAGLKQRERKKDGGYDSGSRHRRSDGHHKHGHKARGGGGGGGVDDGDAAAVGKGVARGRRDDLDQRLPVIQSPSAPTVSKTAAALNTVAPSSPQLPKLSG